MIKKLPLFAVALVLAVAGAARLSAQNGPNGTNPRPFYVIAHNPNTVVDAFFGLLAGANALEPDLMVLEPGAVDVQGHPDPTGVLVVYHDHVLLTSRVPQTLEEYIDGVHLLAKQFPQLAMIMFDIKHQAATCANGLLIQNLVKTHLNIDGVNLNVIYNVGTKEDAVAFRDVAKGCSGILGQLGEREGVQVDGEDDPAQMVALLKDAEGGNIAYGDGTLGLGPNLPRILDHASFLKASWSFPRWNYVYTIDLTSTMNAFIDAGVDGIIPDFPDPFHPEFDVNLTPPHIATLKSLVGPPTHPEIRMAKPEDNPFKPALEAYGVKVRTMDVQGAGTDAKLTFTLNGCRGSAAVTVDTGLIHAGYQSGRMERDQTDWVTIPSLNLGKLTSLTIFNDGSGLDPFPDWDLGDVAISSARWLGPDFFGNAEYTGAFNATLAAHSSGPLDLIPGFQEPEPTIECPAPITVNNAAGKCNAVVNFAPKVDGMCPDVTATSVPASGTAFDVGTTSVTSTAASPSFPQSHPMCKFSVTVKDVEAPLIACPAPMTVDATGPLGATATFAPTAGDNCSAAVSSVPASGSVFAIGTTTVNSTAQDPSGNQASCSFTVHVKGAAEQLADLITAVTNLSAKDGTRTSLLAKLQTALAKVPVNDMSACGTLSAFINEVTSHRGKDISVVDADALIAKATQIRAVLGC